MVQILPGVDEYLRPGIEKLGDTIGLFTETDRATQKAIRNMMLENPDLVQDFADLEHRSPGTLKKMGFGKMADTVTKVGPSLALQRELEIGRREIDVESQQLAFKERVNSLVQRELERNPNISATQLGAMVSGALGVPRDAELEREILELIPLELQAQRALSLMQAASIGDDIEGSIRDYVVAFRAGVDNSEITGALMAHPVLGPQWEAIDKMLDDELNHERDKELANMRMSVSEGKVPLTLQNQLFEIATTKPLIAQYKTLLDSWFKLNRAQRIAAVTGIGNADNQKLAGDISSMKQQLSGKMRLAVVGPGAVSDQERAMLLNSIGNPTSFGALIFRDPLYTYGQFEAMNRSLLSIEKSLMEQVGTLGAGGGSSSSTTIEFPSFLMDDLIKSGMNPTQIKAFVDAYMSGGREP